MFRAESFRPSCVMLIRAIRKSARELAALADNVTGGAARCVAPKYKCVVSCKHLRDFELARLRPHGHSRGEQLIRGKVLDKLR